MRIPYKTVRGRFYVATHHDHAFSSWPSLDEARASYVRLKKHCPDEANKVIGILKIGPGISVTWYPKDFKNEGA